MSISRSRIAAFLLLAATFLVGLIAGITLDRFSLLRDRRLAPRHDRFVSDKVVRRLDRALDLTPRQEAQVRSIVDRRRERLEKLWKESEPRISSEMKAAHDEIEAILTAEQKAKFEELTERWRRFGGAKERSRSHGQPFENAPPKR